MFGYSGKVDHLLMPPVVQKLNTVSPATRIHFKLKLSITSEFQYSVLVMMGVA